MSFRLQIDLRGKASAPYKEADRIWFKVLPGREYRCRRLHDGEPRPNSICTHVVVHQISPGLREKHYFGHPSMTERLDAVESEGMCMHLWELAEGTRSETERNKIARKGAAVKAAAGRSKP